MGFVNPKFEIKSVVNTDERLIGGPYENNEVRQYRTVQEERFLVTAQGVQISPLFFYKDQAQEWLNENCTVPGINYKFKKERNLLRGEILQLQRSLNSLDQKQKEEIQRRVKWLTKCGK